MVDTHGHWLCNTGAYSEHIVAQQGLDPVLQLPDERNAECPLWSRKASVTLLSISARDGKREVSRADFNHASDLKAHLDSKAVDPAGTEPCGRIFIMENLSHDFIGYLGLLFQIPPRFFVEHERNLLSSHGHRRAQFTPRLRSAEERARTHILRYYEALDFGVKPPAFMLRCAATGRYVGAHIANGRLEQVGLLKRHCSYWSNDTGMNKCWDVLILSDPPLTQLRMPGHVRDNLLDIRPEPLQGGYVDFLGANAQDLRSANHPGPGRRSLREDFCYYVTRLAAEEDRSGCRSVFARNILHKIVASHYVRFLEYERSTVSNHEWYTSGLQDLDIFRQREVEKQWSYLQLVNRRLIAYTDDITDIVRVCSRLRKDDQLHNSSSEENITQDFEAVAEGVYRIKLRVEQLINSMTGLASIVGNKQAVRESRRSLREAKTVKTLTTLGMVFAPLALVCGLFSMHSFYLPGSGHFWLYFAVGIPLIVLVFLVFYVVDQGYGEDGDWSLLRLVRSFQKMKPMTK